VYLWNFRHRLVRCYWNHILLNQILVQDAVLYKNMHICRLTCNKCACASAMRKKTIIETGLLYRHNVTWKMFAVYMPIVVFSLLIMQDTLVLFTVFVKVTSIENLA
jgi:hypothetical protein